MCGIAGFIDPSEDDTTRREILEAMTRSIAHRGPDAHGAWLGEPGVALGHRRLSIIDLSDAGRQPMVSSDERWVIIYNGEVYNAAPIRAELEAKGRRFRGTSDTEVILEACAEWSVERAIPRFNGMFAIALWDRAEHELWLIRDRLGIKPLYWTRDGARISFGSELKALRRDPKFDARVRRDAIASFFRHGYIPGPHTIYENVFQLAPGTMLTFAVGSEAPVIRRYWDLLEHERSGRSQRAQHVDVRESEDALDELLRDAVGRRMVADVPLGAFLSGGIDSSLVAAMMQAQSQRPVKTYSIGFSEPAFDEAPFARAVARHLGTDHTELYASPAEALALIPELSTWYDEPFADSSQIPTMLVSRLTRRHVTVALSGDGGDELFAGYDRYFWALGLRRWISPLPAAARRLAARGAATLAAELENGSLKHLPAPLARRVTSSRVRKLESVLSANDDDALYREIVSLWSDPATLAPGHGEAKGRLWDPEVTAGVASPLERMQLLDLLSYLPDDILTKVDRASMAVALEARVPLLDYRVVEHAWTLPQSLKVRDGQGKWILRRILSRYVPQALFDRPKKGFGVPLAAWLRGPLRDWAEDLLEENRLSREGFVAPRPVREMWRQHQSGERDCSARLWTVLMLQSWLARWA